MPIVCGAHQRRPLQPHHIVVALFLLLLPPPLLPLPLLLLLLLLLLHKRDNIRGDRMPRGTRCKPRAAALGTHARVHATPRRSPHSREHARASTERPRDGPGELPSAIGPLPRHRGRRRRGSKALSTFTVGRARKTAARALYHAVCIVTLSHCHTVAHCRAELGEPRVHRVQIVLKLSELGRLGRAGEWRRLSACRLAGVLHVGSSARSHRAITCLHFEAPSTLARAKVVP